MKQVRLQLYTLRGRTKKRTNLVIQKQPLIWTVALWHQAGKSKPRLWLRPCLISFYMPLTRNTCKQEVEYNHVVVTAVLAFLTPPLLHVWMEGGWIQLSYSADGHNHRGEI